MGRLARILAAWTLVLLAAAPAARASEREGMRVHIIHGYAASPADHWFPWLERELERRGARVDIVELPASDAPRPEAWLQALEVQVGRPDRNTFFVAHSLGGITLLRYLESLQPEPEVAATSSCPGSTTAWRSCRSWTGSCAPNSTTTGWRASRPRER